MLVTARVRGCGLGDAAVEWQDGPVLVVAGPGSGKTRVLTYRIARLIAESSDARFRVLGITFTNKAAAEMRQRIDALVAQGRERVQLTTFHSFAVEILRQHGSHVGLMPAVGATPERCGFVGIDQSNRGPRHRPRCGF
jgi:superfamily I DNA/RNA helicase